MDKAPPNQDSSWHTRSRPFLQTRSEPSKQKFQTEDTRPEHVVRLRLTTSAMAQTHRVQSLAWTLSESTNSRCSGSSMGKGGKMTEQETSQWLSEKMLLGQSKAVWDDIYLHPNTQKAKGLHRKSQASQGYKTRSCPKESQNNSGQNKQTINCLKRQTKELSV